MAAVKPASVYLTRLSDLEFGGRCSQMLGATVGEIVTEAEYDNHH